MIVQLEFILIDQYGNPIETIDYHIKTENYEISFEVSMIHDITTERAINEGVPHESVLSIFNDLLHDVESVVTYNNFDW